MIVRAIILLSLVLSGLVAPPAHATRAPAVVSAAASSGSGPALAASAVTAVKPRAEVSGSYVVVASGKVRVSLNSTSTRVKLTWRTAKNKKRAAVVKVRKGVAVKTLPKGSKKVVAQAKATKKLRAGVKTPIRAYSPPPVVTPPTSPPTVGNPPVVSPPLVGPSVPVGLFAVPGDGEVDLGWRLTGGVTWRVLQSGSAGGPWVPVVEAQSNLVTVTGLTNGTEYYFAVVAVASGLTSGVSPPVRVVPRRVPELSPQLAPNARVLVPGAALGAVDLGGGAVRLSVAAGHEVGGVGDLLAIQPSSWLPKGMFARVTSVAPSSDGGSAVEVVPAALDEVFPGEQINFESDFVFPAADLSGDGVLAASRAGGVTAMALSPSIFECHETGGAPRAPVDLWETGNPFPITAELSNMRVVQNLDPGNALLSRGPSLVLGVYGELDTKFALTVKTGFTCKLSASWRRAHALSTVVANIAGVPVTARFEWMFEFGASAAGSMGFTQHRYWGITVDKPEDRPIDVRRSGSVDPAKFDAVGQLSASVYGGGDISVMFGGGVGSANATAGLYVAFGPQIEAGVQTVSPLCFNVDLALRAEGGIRLNLWVKRWDLEIISVSTDKTRLLRHCPFGDLPDPPNAPTLTPGDRTLAATWTPPTYDGGTPIISYTATAEPGGATCTITGALTCTIGGLTNGVRHTVTVTATNSAGTSQPSSGATGTPRSTWINPPSDVRTGTDWIARDPDTGASVQVRDGSIYRIADAGTFLCLSQTRVVWDIPNLTALAQAPTGNAACDNSGRTQWTYTPTARGGNTGTSIILRNPTGNAWLINSAGEIQTIPDGGTYLCLATTNPIIWNTPNDKITDWTPAGTAPASCGGTSVPGSLSQVNTSAAGEPSNYGTSGYTGYQASPNGEDVFFLDQGSNLVPGAAVGGFGSTHLYRKSMSTGKVEILDRPLDPAVSSMFTSFDLASDGSTIAFSSADPNLAPGDENARHDVFVAPASGGAVERVSLAAGGGDPNGGSYAPALAPDGAWVAFASRATNLVSGDGPACGIYVTDLGNGQTRLVSDGCPPWSMNPEMLLSPDGMHLAYSDTNGQLEIVSVESGITRRLSQTPAGEAGNGYSGSPSWSPDGRRLAFASSSSNLVAGDSNNAQDVFIADIESGGVERLALGADQGGVSSVDWSPGGDQLAFASWTSTLVPGDTNDHSDVFTLDLNTGAIARVSTDASGGQLTYGGSSARFTPDGRRILFSAYSGVGVRTHVFVKTVG